LDVFFLLSRVATECSLALTAALHTYEEAGKYRILVKVTDIFGNNASQAFEVKIK